MSQQPDDKKSKTETAHPECILMKDVVKQHEPGDKQREVKKRKKKQTERGRYCMLQWFVIITKYEPLLIQPFKPSESKLN